MGMPAEATPEDRAARRRLARAIYDAVVNDEESPLTAEENRDDLAFGLAQECIDLERERDQYDVERRTFYQSFALMSDSRRAIANAVRAYLDGPPSGREAAIAITAMRQALTAIVDPNPKTHDVPDADIETAIGYMRRASKGPAAWTLPATGVGKHPLIGFVDTLYHDALDSEGVNELREAIEHVIDRYELSVDPLHGVSIPAPGQTVEGVYDGSGDHDVVAITGNGPTSQANAQAITLAFEPVIGYEAMLLEVRRLRDENAMLRQQLAAPVSTLTFDASKVSAEDLAELQSSAALRTVIIENAPPSTSPSKRWAHGAIDDLAETIRRRSALSYDFERALTTLVACAKMDSSATIVTRDEAIEIAVRHAKEQAPSYYVEPFEPHEWVVRAILEAGARR